MIPWREANRLVIPRSEATWESRVGSCSPYRPSLKQRAPITSVAAVTAQPLAALPPYGCGVPFTGVERLWQLHISARFRRPCNAPGLSLRGGRRPTWRPERAARGSALGVQSRRVWLHRGEAVGEIVTAFPRLPRRFAPRNDKLGGLTP